MLKASQYHTKLRELVNGANILNPYTSLFESFDLACVCYNLEDWFLLEWSSVSSGLCDWRKSVIMEATDSGLLRWMWWSPSMLRMVACRGLRKIFLLNNRQTCSTYACVYVCTSHFLISPALQNHINISIR